MRIRRKHFLRLFERGDRLIAGNGWKVVEKLGQRAAGLKVIQQGLRRDTSPYEYRGSAKNLRVTVNHSFSHDGNLQASSFTLPDFA